jgi:hypothetical protein
VAFVFLFAALAFADPLPSAGVAAGGADPGKDTGKGTPMDIGQPPNQMRRFALVVGSNGGGGGRERLKYAASDAKSFAALMTELGGVRQGDLTLLIEPRLAALGAALGSIREEAARAEGSGARSELVFYYSGHSDETGLLLGTEKLGYSQLRADLEAVQADLRVAILDSCASGAMTRAKGGTPRPAFVFDESSDMRGHAYITSSSAAESAQESDRLGGSFFTHYLISGLRGAADSLGQGRVTLNEAYAYAFNETLASTEQTQFGPQHPAYEINLTGTGDLVLTDLRASTAGLLLADELRGRVFVRDARGMLAVELSKVPGKRVELGMAPGTYSVLVDDSGRRSTGDVRIAKGSYALLSPADLKPVTATPTAARGGPIVTEGEKIVIDTAFFDFQLLPDLKQAFFSSQADRTFAINALMGSTRELHGFEVAGLVNTESLGMSGFQAAGLANAVLGPVSGFQAAGLANYAGGDMGYVQFAGLANISGGKIVGAQFAGLFNLAQAGRVLYIGKESLGFVGELPAPAGETNVGFQAAGIGNIGVGSFAGLQLAGVANWTSSKTVGVQVAGVFNRAGALSGAQIATVNLASDLQGAQIAVVNLAGDLQGGQFGLVNSSRSQAGAQVGLVNVAGELWGAQVGLVNVVERIHGPSIGLVTIEKDGVIALEASSDLEGRALALLKVGTRFSYTMIGAGFETPQAPSNWNLALGLGLRLPLGGFFFDADASWRYYLRDTGGLASLMAGSQVAVGRLLLGLQIGGGPAALVGGVAVELRMPTLSLGADGKAEADFAWKPRFVLGVQL